MGIPFRNGGDVVSWADELVESLKVQERPEDSISSYELAEKTGKSQSHCNSLLLKKYGDGELDRLKVGRIHYYFKK